MVKKQKSVLFSILIIALFSASTTLSWSGIDFGLMLAALRGNLTLVKKLLDQGANINAKDGRGKTILMETVTNGKNGKLEIVKELLDRGVAINARDNSGETALIYAIHLGHLNIVRELLMRGADIPERDDLSVIERKFPEAMKLLGALNRLKQDLDKKIITRPQALEENVKNGDSLLVGYILHNYKFDVNLLRKLLNIAKNNFLKETDESLKQEYKKIGRLLVAQIGISKTLSSRGVLEGENLPGLPSEIVGEISSHVDISDVS